MSFADAVVAIPGAEHGLLGAEWPALRRLCFGGQLRANAPPDAWLAAAVVQHGEHLATLDAGFRELLGRGLLAPLKAA